MSEPADPLDEQLRALARPVDPPSSLEDRVVEALRAQGLLRRRPKDRRSWLMASAAGLAGAALGWLGRGSWSSVPAADERPEYLLLLSPYLERPDEATETGLVREHRAWARGLREAGHLVYAERLGDETVVVGAPDARLSPSGFFLVRARSLDEALAIARSCPHVRHGGTITVRDVAPT